MEGVPVLNQLTKEDFEQWLSESPSEQKETKYNQVWDYLDRWGIFDMIVDTDISPDGFILGRDDSYSGTMEGIEPSPRYELPQWAKEYLSQ